VKRLLLLVVAVAIAIPACAQQDTRGTEAQQEKTQDPGTATPEKGTTLPKEPVAGAVEITGVIEKPEITSYMYGTHAITDEASGTRYALRSGEEGLLDRYTGQRVTVFGTPVPGYEGDLEGGPPLLEVTRVEPVAANI
jgi:hypothetical protein